MFALDKTSLTRKNKIDLSRSSICADFKDLTWFRQNLLFSSSLKKTKEDCLQAGSGWHFLNVHWDLRYWMSSYPVKRIQNHVDHPLNSLRLCSCSTKLRKWFTQFQHFENKRNVEKILTFKLFSVPNNAILRGVIKSSALNVAILMIQRSDKEEDFFLTSHLLNLSSNFCLAICKDL